MEEQPKQINKNEDSHELNNLAMHIVPQKIFWFAVITLLALIFSLGSLTIISSRQSQLSSIEGEIRSIEERISASVIINSKSPDSINSEGMEELKIEYRGLTSDIDDFKYIINEGSFAPLPNTKVHPVRLFYETFISLDNLSTNTLLGILLISCGILGSIMSTMRDGEGQAPKVIVLGASVGFIALLGVKGGSTVFVMATNGVDVPFNPYSTAFAGVVAGMFSEKLYLALSKLTDKALGDEKK